MQASKSIRSGKSGQQIIKKSPNCGDIWGGKWERPPELHTGEKKKKCSKCCLMGLHTLQSAEKLPMQAQKSIRSGKEGAVNDN